MFTIRISQSLTAATMFFLACPGMWAASRRYVTRSPGGFGTVPTFGKQWTLRTYHHEHRVEKVSLNVAKEGVFRDDLPEKLPPRRSVDLLKQRKWPSLQCAPCINFSQQISLLFGITGLTCSRRAKYVEASPHTGHPCFLWKTKDPCAP